MNRATPTHAPLVVPNIERTIDHAPETESWGVTLPASEIGPCDRRTNDRPQGVYIFLKPPGVAIDLLHDVEAADCFC